MKIQWEAKDVRAGRRICTQASGKALEWMICEDAAGPNRFIVCLNDGKARLFSGADIVKFADWLSSGGYIPVELLEALSIK